MKKRIISAIIALIIVVPLIIMGGVAFNIGVYIIAMLALKEFFDVRKKQMPIFIQLIAYIFMTLLILLNTNSNTANFIIDYRILIALFMTLLIPTVLYHDKEKYNANDAFYLIGGILFLGISMSLFITVRNISLNIFIFLLLISMINDIFAYTSGTLIGKHKLLTDISPKKTWEGMIIGTLMSVFISALFYHTIIDPIFSKEKLLIICTFLSILGVFGDLIFSAIKRYYDKKDFGNIMPGHGGILDRLDSLIFVILGYMFFITMF